MDMKTIYDNHLSNGQEKNPDIVDIDTLQSLDLHGFCDSAWSRLRLRGQTSNLGYAIPPIDIEGIKRDLPKIYKSAKDLKSLMSTIQLFNDTYFYPASLISLVLFDDKQHITRIQNAKTFAKLTRTKRDWALDRANSLANFVLYQFEKKHPENYKSVGVFGSTTTRAEHFFIVPRNIPALSDEDITRMHCEVFYRELTTITDFELLRKETKLAKTSDEINDLTFCSATLSPIYMHNKLRGALLIGNDFPFTFTSNSHLDSSMLPSLMQFTQYIGLALEKIISHMEWNSHAFLAKISNIRH